MVITWNSKIVHVFEPFHFVVTLFLTNKGDDSITFKIIFQVVKYAAILMGVINK